MNGVVREIDDLGRICVPKDMRKARGWEPGTSLELILTEGGVLVRTYAPYDFCTFCGAETDLTYQGRYICTKCAYGVSEAYHSKIDGSVSPVARAQAEPK